VDGDLARPASEPGGTVSEAGPGRPADRVLLEQDFDFGSLYSLRAAVAAHAAAAGLSGNRLYDVVMTAHELAANAVRHGAGHGRLRLRVHGGLLYCEVSDDGRAAVAADNPCNDEAIGASQSPPGEQDSLGKQAEGDDPAGDSVPAAAWRKQHGHGLWVVSQVAGQFTIDRTAGTAATATFALDGAAPGNAEPLP
jgi:hypothetical protein